MNKPHGHQIDVHCSSGPLHIKDAALFSRKSLKHLDHTRLQARDRLRPFLASNKLNPSLQLLSAPTSDSNAPALSSPHHTTPHHRYTTTPPTIMIRIWTYRLGTVAFFAPCMAFRGTKDRIWSEHYDDCFPPGSLRAFPANHIRTATDHIGATKVFRPRHVPSWYAPESRHECPQLPY